MSDKVFLIIFFSASGVITILEIFSWFALEKTRKNRLGEVSQGTFPPKDDDFED